MNGQSTSLVNFQTVSEGLQDPAEKKGYAGPRVAILTGGGDRPYALGLAFTLIEQCIPCDLIGSDNIDTPEFHQSETLTFLNLRGDQSATGGGFGKAIRVIFYYMRLICYALTTRAKVFHILWHNKFEFIDRIFVMGFYRLLGKRVLFTAHNVNIGKRDGCDSWMNRFSLRMQYRLANRIFVHTELMKRELMAEFAVTAEKIVVIPFGINNTLPKTDLTRSEAREQLEIESDDKTVLFFGNIAPYKGLEYLVTAIKPLIKKDRKLRLVIAGRMKGSEVYWNQICNDIVQSGIEDRVTTMIKFIPDEEVEIYFKAADLLVLPYRHIFQSGVLFLGYSFGLPVLATDVGSLREEIIPGRTGFICRAEDSDDLGRCIGEYFNSDLYGHLEDRSAEIVAFANERYSWKKVGVITAFVYESVI